MNSTDVQRYKRLLLAKLDELSATHSDPTLLAQRAEEPTGDLADQANADADLHIRLYKSDAHLLRAIEGALARITQGAPG